GIRGKLVTGVQTCALPISDRANTTRSRREGREVFATQQPLARIPHRRDIERSRNVELAAPLERIPLSAVSDPIFICPPRRREPGVEVLRRRLERRDRDVLRQEG